ncbi:cupin domain-containing protein [Sphingopyxis sp.]|uniref:cupin domain-containing protein n=1 Tax=Sphingopyxis sp. TaxID=1908224 RepID=UPI003D6DA318
MSAPQVLVPERLPVKDRGHGVVTTPLVTAGRGSQSMLNGITRIAPGAAVPLHIHNCEESVVVMSGTGKVLIDGVETPVAPGVTSWIPPEVPHCFLNLEGSEPLVIFWTYASIEATRTVIASGVTTRIDEE